MLEAALILISFITGLSLNLMRKKEVFEKLPRKGLRICEPYRGEFIKYTLSRTEFYLCSADAKKGDWILLKNKTVQYMGKTEIFN